MKEDLQRGEEIWYYSSFQAEKHFNHLQHLREHFGFLQGSSLPAYTITSRELSLRHVHRPMWPASFLTDNLINLVDISGPHLDPAALPNLRGTETPRLEICLLHILRSLLKSKTIPSDIQHCRRTSHSQSQKYTSRIENLYPKPQGYFSFAFLYYML